MTGSTGSGFYGISHFTGSWDYRFGCSGCSVDDEVKGSPVGGGKLLVVGPSPLTLRILAGSSSSDLEGLSGSAAFSKAPALWNLAGAVLQTGLHAGGPSQGLDITQSSRTHTRSNTRANCGNH